MDKLSPKKKLNRMYRRVITDMLKARKESRIPAQTNNLEKRLHKAAEGEFNMFSLPSFTQEGKPHSLYRIYPGGYCENELGLIFLHGSHCDENLISGHYQDELFLPNCPEFLVYVWQVPYTDKLDRKAYVGTFNDPLEIKELLWERENKWWRRKKAHTKKKRRMIIKNQVMPRTYFDGLLYRLSDNEIVEDLEDLKQEDYDIHVGKYHWMIDCLYQRICPEFYRAPANKSVQASELSHPNFSSSKARPGQ